MKASQFFISTLKEAPADAEITSHRLMMRAGLIKRLAAGIYTYMPMGLRVIRKVENIIREEMNRAGGIEMLMPVIQPADLWQETRRYDTMGPELMRVRDRHDKEFVVQPTSEEVVTDIARQELRSYKQLPKNFYHIQTKFRDERRPRFGIMRGREFTMKDAYSFDRSPEAAAVSYQRMYDAYCAIFNRLGLDYRAVRADTGAIGGDLSHEFQVIADTGEDALVYCPQSDYAANIELAEALPLLDARAAPTQALALTPTPGASTCADVAAFLKLPLQQTLKSLVLACDIPADEAAGTPARAQVVLLLLRGDHDMNEVKVGKLPGFEHGWRFAHLREIEAVFGSQPGYLGPVFAGGRPAGLRVIADRTVALMSDWVCGGNQVDTHYTGVNWGRDLPEPDLVADIRNVVEGDRSPDGAGLLAIQRGIEVGHVFYLGTKYAKAMNATFLDETGKPALMEMGCYGIGVTRLLGASIEQRHDARGIRWPVAMAPFSVVLCPIGMDRSEPVAQAAQQLYQQLLEAGVDVILDDRGERPGAMFADWELIGVPLRVVLSDRGLKEGQLEMQGRSDEEAVKIGADAALDAILSHLKSAA
ncbi:proline--tRNA ligase [Amphibiibacter pelophylacis]|uniref:Proline--tRNA ligase n=1 Tax=Amphibiibacter pelophylacis TaxID=1799477 RepID=A0ACC6P5X2_9BURK